MNTYPFLADLISIKVRVINEELSSDVEAVMVSDYILGLCKAHGGPYPQGLSDALCEYFHEYSDGEEWMYMGRDADGEKSYHLLNPGSVEERVNARVSRLWQGQCAPVAAA